MVDWIRKKLHLLTLFDLMNLLTNYHSIHVSDNLQLCKAGDDCEWLPATSRHYPSRCCQPPTQFQDYIPH